MRIILERAIQAGAANRIFAHIKLKSELAVMQTFPSISGGLHLNLILREMGL
jgi:hypothetical protein